MSIKVQPRDIVFTFKDSCNCCTSCKCFSKKESNPKLYINTQGNVEKYKSKKTKGNMQKAFDRAMFNLSLTLERKVTSFEGSPISFQYRVSNILNSISQLKEVNLSHVEAINNLMLQYFDEVQKK